MNLFDLLHQKLELFRLEQRYTRRRNRRSTFVSEAQYVDGEYIYAQNTSYSANNSATGSSDSDETTGREDGMGSQSMKNKGRRLSVMAKEWRGKVPGGGSVGAGGRGSRVSVREVRWEGERS